jgi:DNA-binding beta-propeller fold protein YncE
MCFATSLAAFLEQLDCSRRAFAEEEQSYRESLEKLVLVLSLSDSESRHGEAKQNRERQRMLTWQETLFADHLALLLRSMKRRADAEEAELNNWLASLDPDCLRDISPEELLQRCAKDLEQISAYDATLSNLVFSLGACRWQSAHPVSESCRAREALYQHLESIRVVRRDKLLRMCRRIEQGFGWRVKMSHSWNLLGATLCSGMGQGFDSFADLRAALSVWPEGIGETAKHDKGSDLDGFQAADLGQMIQDLLAAARSCEGYEARHATGGYSPPFRTVAETYYVRRLWEKRLLITRINRRYAEIVSVLHINGRQEDLETNLSFLLGLLAMLTSQLCEELEAAYRRSLELRGTRYMHTAFQAGCSQVLNYVLPLLTMTNECAERIELDSEPMSTATRTQVRSAFNTLLESVESLADLQQRICERIHEEIDTPGVHERLHPFFRTLGELSDFLDTISTKLLECVAHLSVADPQLFSYKGFWPSVSKSLTNPPLWIVPSLPLESADEEVCDESEGLSTVQRMFSDVGVKLLTLQLAAQSEIPTLANSCRSGRCETAAWQIRLVRRQWLRLLLQLARHHDLSTPQSALAHMFVTAAARKSVLSFEAAEEQTGTTFGTVDYVSDLLALFEWSVSYEKELALAGDSGTCDQRFTNVLLWSLTEADHLYWKLLDATETAIDASAEHTDAERQAAHNAALIVERFICTAFDCFVDLLARRPELMTMNLIERLAALQIKLPPAAGLNGSIRRWHLLRHRAGLGSDPLAIDETAKERLKSIEHEHMEPFSSRTSVEVFDTRRVIETELQKLRTETIGLLGCIHRETRLGVSVPDQATVRRVAYLERMEIELGSILRRSTENGRLAGAITRRRNSWSSSHIELGAPIGLATAGKTHMYVADCNGNRVLRISEREMDVSVVGDASAQQHVIHPFGISVRSDGTLYVTSGDFVLVLSPEGKLARRIGGPGTDPGHLKSPGSVTVDQKGSLYVADSLNNRIQKFSEQGKLLDCWGGTGSAALVEPSSIALHPDGKSLLIGEFGGTRILHFWLDGTHRETWSLPAGHLGPEGLCYLRDGLLLITCRYSDSLVVLDATGTPVGKIDCSLDIPRPMGVCEMDSGSIYVSSLGISHLVCLDHGIQALLSQHAGCST